MPRMEPARRKHDHRAQGNERGKSRGRFFRVQGNPTRADTFSSTCGNFSISDCRSRCLFYPALKFMDIVGLKRRPGNRFCPPSFASIDSEHCEEAEHRGRMNTPKGGRGARGVQRRESILKRRTFDFHSLTLALSPRGPALACSLHRKRVPRPVRTRVIT